MLLFHIQSVRTTYTPAQHSAKEETKMEDRAMNNREASGRVTSEEGQRGWQQCRRGTPGGKYIFNITNYVIDENLIACKLQ